MFNENLIHFLTKQQKKFFTCEFQRWNRLIHIVINSFDALGVDNFFQICLLHSIILTKFAIDKVKRALLVSII